MCDNGSGISPEDYECVACRHHTSKIKAFSDVKVSHDKGGIEARMCTALNRVLLCCCMLFCLLQ